MISENIKSAEKIAKQFLAAIVEFRSIDDRDSNKRRSDQMSVRMKPSTRALIESLAEAEGVPIAEIVERAIAAYAKSAAINQVGMELIDAIAKMRNER